MAETSDFARAEALGDRAQSLIGQGHPAEAWGAYDQAVRLQPNLAWVIGGRGEAARLLGRFHDALADFSRVIELIPDHAAAYALRGETYRMLGRLDEARADYHRALERDPTNAIAIQWRNLPRSMTYEEAVTIAEAKGALQPQTVREKMAAALVAPDRPFAQSDLARERLHSWALAVMRGEDPRETLR